MTIIFNITVFALVVVIYTLIFFKRKFSYWRNKGVPFIEPQFPFGTYENPFKKAHHIAFEFQKQYHHLKSLGYKYGGLYSFGTPELLLVNTELIRNVMSRDFQYFTDRGFYLNIKDDPLSANLFNLEGQSWRNLRVKLTPTFTTGKIKAMFSTLVACGDPLYAALTQFTNENEPIEIKDLSARYFTDVIGSCAFGLSCNSFMGPESDFRKYGGMMFLPRTKLQACKFLIASLNHPLGRLLRITKTNLQSMKFFLNVVKQTINYRKQNNVVRKDFMQLLMELLDEDDSDTGLTIEQIAAQAFIFFLAGFETSSTTMTFCLYELANNQKIQETVRDEIITVLARYNGNITYDAIMEMKYLNCVIDETLRKYPPLAAIPRVCVQNYQIPDTKIVIEKRTRIIIPAYALQHDPEYFKDPETFNPDRFNDENKSKIKSHTYLPFGEGPRNCIAIRFGLLQTKVGLVTLLKDVKFQLNAKKTNTPIKFARSGFVLTAKGGIWLNAEKIGS